MTRDDITQYEEAWRRRGYWIEESEQGPVIAGDHHQFYQDAVANDLEAAKLMEFIRDNSPEEYQGFWDMAQDDDIDLSYSQDVYIKGAAAAGWGA